MTAPLSDASEEERKKGVVSTAEWEGKGAGRKEEGACVWRGAGGGGWGVGG